MCFCIPSTRKRNRAEYAGDVSTPDVELQWWEGCPSTERALQELRDALADVGMPGAKVRTLEIKTEEEARRHGFFGSPTVLINGRDAVGAEPDELPGLNCRVYRRRDGAVSPTPDPDDLREALRLAAERAEVTR
jgi:hypothetical protein